jgi:hypothetical protein
LGASVLAVWDFERDARIFLNIGTVSWNEDEKRNG